MMDWYQFLLADVDTNILASKILDTDTLVLTDQELV